MRISILLPILLFRVVYVHAQITVAASDSIGSGYDDIYQAGLDLENPDCVHADFGPHITRSYDELLARNIFDFHSHIVEDNDRCQTFDRVRMEIKGGPNTNPESQHLEGSESFYRWKFKIPKDFKGSSSFCHIFQNKIKGGTDSSFPVITITPRTNRLEVIHNGGDSGTDLGRLINEDLDPFLGVWIEAFVYQMHGENGKIEVVLKNLQSGKELASYKNDNIDLWRPGADYSRPKWGVYRKKVDGLKDEIIQFADFCISEVSSELCPADTLVLLDLTPPSAPSNLRGENIEISSVDLLWDKSEDNFGVSSYILYQDGDSIWSGTSLNTKVSNLSGSTSYFFTLRAKDEAGNISEASNELEIRTDPLNSLPDSASGPFPQDGSLNVDIKLTLRWINGGNTDSSYVYLGEQEDSLLLLSKQIATEIGVDLDYDTEYYWRIDQINANGRTEGQVWSFRTAPESGNGNWLVYRANSRPDLETSFLEIRDLPESPEIDQILSDQIVNSNNIYQFLEEGEEKFRWRFEFPESDTAFTVLARIKGMEASNTITYFEVRLGGVREKLRINHNTFKLEKSSPVVESEYPFDFDKDFHLVRVTMKDKIMKVYLDENPIPLVSGFSETSDAGSNFEFGKSGGPAAGCFVDWIAIQPNKELGPEEGELIPEDLILSNDASIANLYLNGVRIEDFQSSSLEVDVNIASSEIPQIEVEMSSKFAEYNVETFDSSDTIYALITTLANDQVSSKTYRINFLRSSRTNEFITSKQVWIYPNPSDGQFTLSLLEGGRAEASFFDSSGRLILQRKINDLYEFKDKFAAGLYIVKVTFDEGGEFTTKIIIR